MDEGNDDRSDLDALAAAVARPGSFSERLAGVADLDEMAAMLAVERYIGHWDGYTGDPDIIFPPESGDAAPPNNYYLHSDASGVFSLMPWGTDQTFTRDHTFDRPRTDGPEHYLMFDSPSALLLDGCLADEACSMHYLDTLASLPDLVESLGLLATHRPLPSSSRPTRTRTIRGWSTSSRTSPPASPQPARFSHRGQTICSTRPSG